MKSSRCKQVVQVVLLIVLTICAGTWALGKVTSGYEQARERRESAVRLTKKLSSVCVGRFLLDLPEGAQVKLGRARIDGFDIEIFDESRDQFQTRPTQGEAQLQKLPDRSGGSHNLEAVTVVKNENGVAARIFVHGRTVTEGQSSNGLTIERYRYEGVAVEALVHAGDLSIDVSTDFYDPESVGNLESLVAQMVPNPESRIPSEPGFCLDRAYIREPLTAAQCEQIMMSALHPSRPDIEFRMILAAGTAPDAQGLLERHGYWRSRARAPVHLYRNGNRSLGQSCADVSPACQRTAPRRKSQERHGHGCTTATDASWCTARTARSVIPGSRMSIASFTLADTT